ncbi:MAG: spore coat associated protein CotJA [Clostridiales bacterium]|nr:spore coat associated protein CotJA [Clostridiales bacterium]
MDKLEIYPSVNGTEGLFPQQVSLAMLYVPAQRWENLFTPEEALDKGTLFRALDLPFLGGRRMK